MEWIDSFSTPKRCRKALVRVTSSIQQAGLVPCYYQEPVVPGGLELHLLPPPSFNHFLLGHCSYDFTACLTALRVHCPSLFPPSLFSAGQGEKGDAGIKVGTRNTVLYHGRSPGRRRSLGCWAVGGGWVCGSSGVLDGVHICALISHRQALQAACIRLVELDSHQRHFSDYEACW